MTGIGSESSPMGQVSTWMGDHEHYLLELIANCEQNHIRLSRYEYLVTHPSTNMAQSGLIRVPKVLSTEPRF